MIIKEVINCVDFNGKVSTLIKTSLLNESCISKYF